MQRIRFSASFVTLALTAFSLALAGCGSGGPAPPAASISAAGLQEGQSAGESRTGSHVAEVVQVRADGPSNETPARPAIIPAARPEVVLDTSLGKIRLRLFPEQAPITVDNFLTNYVDRGFYDNTIIHYAASGFIIAAGGFSTDYQPAEPRAYIASEADNGLKNVRGTVAMSRDPEHMDSANCQFFINLADNPSLDHKSRDDAASFGYCVFGEVVEGMDVVDRISELPVVDQEGFPSTPQEKVIIRSITRTR
jgi:cyclophilin family peptidyl-prolyl cis-trans isomerase